MEERKCLYCGKPFLAVNQQRQYCSSNCGSKANQRKKFRPKSTKLKNFRLPTDRVKTTWKHVTSLNWQEGVLQKIAEEEEKWKKPPSDAVWVRTGGIYPGFLLRPEEVKRLEEVIKSWTGGRLVEPVKIAEEIVSSPQIKNNREEKKMKCIENKEAWREEVDPNVDVKPCPFCGCPPVVKYPIIVRQQYYLECSNEFCPGTPATPICERVAQAVKMWNTRKEEKQPQTKENDNG